MDARLLLAAQCSKTTVQDMKLTVLVMSAEHTSQMYFTPPSLPRVAVFFLMTAMVAAKAQNANGIVREVVNRRVGMGCVTCGARQTHRYSSLIEIHDKRRMVSSST